MNKFTKKVIEILLMPVRASVRCAFKLAHGIKGLTPGKVISGVSGLGEKVVKLIYGVGLKVENIVKLVSVSAYNIVFIKGTRFVYRTGELTIKYTVKAAVLIKNIVMIIPKSVVRDFSYWAAAISAVGVVAIVFSTNFYALALKVKVNGETVGYVASEQEFSNIVSKVEDELGDSIGENYVMASKPEYSFTVVNKTKIEQSEVYDDVYNIVCEEIGEHYGLYVDGKLIAATETEKEITDVLDELKAPYKTDAKDESVEFVANVQIRKGIYAPSYFIGEDDIRAKFSASTNPRYYTIKEDDYLSDISKATGLSRSQIYALNPGLDDKKLVPGKKLNISQPDVYLGIKIVRTVKYTEEINYETIKKNDNTLYKTQTKVKTEGKKGEKEITAKVTYIDGASVSKEIIREEVTRQPVNREVYVGTKSLPASTSKTSTSPLAGTGTFIRPINGGYTSCGFGGYSGHNGADLTMSGAYGKPVYASAAGTVIYAGWSGGYGKLVKIQHSNGYVTWYAHMSAITVTVGESVYQGQQVGRIGATGNATGPHLHFELRINGSAVNPMKYVG